MHRGPARKNSAFEPAADAGVCRDWGAFPGNQGEQGVWVPLSCTGCLHPTRAGEGDLAKPAVCHAFPSCFFLSTTSSRLRVKESGKTQRLLVPGNLAKPKAGTRLSDAACVGRVGLGLAPVWWCFSCSYRGCGDAE